MERVWHHFSVWEDHMAGQYAETYGDEPGGAADASLLLGCPPDLEAAMEGVVREWPLASEQNLSHTAQNRNAWLGQAACCWQLGTPAYVTKQGWRMLEPWEQDAANDVADQVILRWEAGRAETLFAM